MFVAGDPETIGYVNDKGIATVLWCPEVTAAHNQLRDYWVQLKFAAARVCWHSKLFTPPPELSRCSRMFVESRLKEKMSEGMLTPTRMIGSLVGNHSGRVRRLRLDRLDDSTPANSPPKAPWAARSERRARARVPQHKAGQPRRRAIDPGPKLPRLGVV